MSGMFLWLRRNEEPPAVLLKEVKRLISSRGYIKSKGVDSRWKGHFFYGSEEFIKEIKGSVIYYDQTATGIRGNINLDDAFNGSILDGLEGIWILLEVFPETGTVRVAQDRLAGMPLYYYREGKDFIVSSEIKLIRAAKPGKCQINLPLLAGNLLTSLPPHFDDGTFFNGINKLKPGKVHTFKLESNGYESRNYTTSLGFQPLWETLTHEKLQDAARLLRSELRDSIKRNLESISGKVALPLSGGVDSSVIAVELKELRTPFKAFTVAYPDAPGDESDESPSANLTAQKLGIPIRVVEIERKGLLDYTDQHVLLHESPLPTLVYYVAWLMEREIKARGFKTVATGNSAGISIGGVISWWLGALSCSNPALGFSKFYSWRDYVSLKQMLAGMLTFLSIPSRKFISSAWMHRNMKPWIRIKPRFSGWFIQRDRSYSDYRLRHNLEYETHNIYIGDMRMWDYHKIKPIIPFFNLKFIEKVRSLPASFFIHKGWNKFLARYAYSKDLPSEVIWDRRKRGFGSPLNKWINESWNEEIKEAVLSSSKMNEMVNRERLASDFHQLPPGLKWRLYTTSRFLELFK